MHSVMIIVVNSCHHFLLSLADWCCVFKKQQRLCADGLASERDDIGGIDR